MRDAANYLVMLLGRRLAARGAFLSRRSSSISLPGVPRRLGEVAKVELFEAEEPSRIGAIWESFHEDRPELAGCSVPADEHVKITERARESPLFIFPVRREQGHFLLLSQFNAQSDMFVMTFLEDYKRNPAAAQPWLSVTLFGELLTSKAVGLLRADIAPERLSKPEGEHMMALERAARSNVMALARGSPCVQPPLQRPTRSLQPPKRRTPSRVILAAAGLANKSRRSLSAFVTIQVRRYYGTDDYDRVWTFNHAERHFNLDAYLSVCP